MTTPDPHNPQQPQHPIPEQHQYGAPQTSPYAAPVQPTLDQFPASPPYGRPVLDQFPQSPAYGTPVPPSPPYGVPVAQFPPSPAYGTPAVTPPESTGYHQPPAPAAKPAGRKPIVVLGVLAGVFLVVAGVFLALYLVKNGEYDRTSANRAEKDRELSSVKDDQGKEKKTLEGNKSKESSLKNEHDLLTQCVDASKAYLALPRGVTPESTRLFNIMYDICPQI
ncbi:hypothetical protein [Actinosynnema sp. NPDC020468]|uniref:hypothetical protein n=1 Tax=Actinosynnema sp. NPDC020468 TaxID=3154488 RepID=UPI0033EF4DEF